jgi:hypothetical protein
MFSLIVLLWLLLAGISTAGFVTNVVWLFQHFASAITLETLVSIAGVIVPPLGIMHGIYTWF